MIIKFRDYVDIQVGVLKASARARQAEYQRQEIKKWR
jgi:hypothetical protein